MANFNKRVFESTGRHLVTLSCVQRVPGDTKEYLQLISGFIVELVGQWLFVTAGHVLKEIQAAIDGGAEFDVASSRDSLLNSTQPPNKQKIRIRVPNE
jgi:hypothetical protein